MKTNHTLAYTAHGPSSEKAKANLILLHGMGHTDAIAFHDLAAAIPNDVRTFALRGPIPFGQTSGTGYAWFEITPVASGPPQPNLEQERTSRASIGEFIDSCGTDLPLILMGFGQGAVLAAHLYLEHPEKMQLCVLGAARVMPHIRDQYPIGPAHRDVPLIWTHGKDDPILPFSAAQATAESLRQDSLEVTWLPHDGGHEWPDAANGVVSRRIRQMMGVGE
ncbi:phospholipase/carboxylesterase [Hyphomonas adhaerens MHS-3]|uniref:Phospholipase/carboxylesterase n=1 Tax=Hyphomonas adhaerens MHS-3 TaxID=1280949 RepID=A0A069E9M3_9PROT|nr:hypothetical protein [Hyphomonas adhaerens]KCZ86131.1 phospholipase/carboxylesterase [Hyphomonas adhaerens MHS-3]